VDENQLKQLKEEYKSFNTEVKSFVHDRILALKQQYLTEATVKKEVWIKVYVNHPIVRQLSRGLVWTDGSDFFIPSENGITDIKGNPYDPKEKITLASVLNMDLQVVKGWQDYILAHNLKQPFEQMWEPVFDFTKNHEFSELIGTTLPASERNEMKKSLKDKGIEVYSDQNEVSYDYYQMKYVFSNRNRMHFGNYIDAEYTINDDKSIKFETFRVKDYRKKRAVNTIVLTLLKAVVKSIIISDSAEKLSRDYLRLFTVAQIISFISAANDHDSIKCKAVLMDYKNETYPEYNALEDLILDL
jgi:hypothetical protein